VPSWLRKARTALGLTIWQVATAVGCSPTTLSTLERGHITRPDLERKLRVFFSKQKGGAA
jgi:transcriptional regulator with XRE-family HTH domain